MHNEKDNLNIFYPSTNHREGVVVYGEPIHEAKQELIEKYISMPLEEFLSFEQRNSIGSYALVDTTKRSCRVITSIGYCGGYIRKTSNGTNVSTLLRDALHIEIDTVEFEDAVLAYLLSYVPSSTWGSLPLSTAFKDIQRLNAAAVLDLNHGGVARYTTYLKLGSMVRPSSFEEAVWDTATNIARWCERTGKMPAVMFSGGADSLLIFLALQRAIGKDKVKAISIITSKAESLTNGHYRAIPVARSLGMEIQIDDSDWESSEVVADEIIFQMRNDLINSRRPDLALAKATEKLGTVFRGQNFDAMSGSKMVTLDACLDRDLLSEQLLGDDTKVNLQLKTLAQNMSFTDDALNNPTYAKSISAYLRKLTPSTVVDPDAGTLAGALRGLIATQIPGLLHAAREPFSRFSQLQVMNAEAEKLVSFLDQEITPAHAFHLCAFYGYSQLAMKRGCSQKLSTGTDISFFAMSGPIVSYFLWRKRAMSDALSPKREIYAFIERMTGQAYTDLKVRNEEDDARINELEKIRKKDDFDTLIGRSKELLEPEKSKVLTHITDDKMRENFKKIYVEIVTNNQPDNANFVRLNQSLSRILINLELLLTPE